MPHESIPDASAQYHLWDDLVTDGYRLALAPGDGDEDGQAARKRLERSLARDLLERDEMWKRLLRHTSTPQR